MVFILTILLLGITSWGAWQRERAISAEKLVEEAHRIIEIQNRIIKKYNG